MGVVDSSGALGRPSTQGRNLGWVLSGAFLPLVGVLMVVDLFLIFMWAPTDEILGHD